MPLARTLICDSTDCGASFTEVKFGDGFPDWGNVGGVLKDGQEVFLCPACKQKVIEFIKGPPVVPVPEP